MPSTQSYPSTANAVHAAVEAHLTRAVPAEHAAVMQQLEVLGTACKSTQ